MTPDGKRHRDRLTAFNRIDVRDYLPVDELPRQMPEEVNYVHPREAFDEFGNSRAHASESGCWSEEHVENWRSHKLFSEASQIFSKFTRRGSRGKALWHFTQRQIRNIWYPSTGRFVMEERSENLEIKRKRLLFRSKHRGTKEMDILLGSFYEENMYEFREEELAEIERILELADDDLYAWSVERQSVPEGLASPVLEAFIESVWQRGGGSSH